MPVTIRSSQEYRRLLSPFIRNQGLHELDQQLELGLDLVKIAIRVDDITTKTWNGELYVCFMQPPDIADVVNNYIYHSGADEISIEGKNSLRLWWD